MTELVSARHCLLGLLRRRVRTQVVQGDPSLRVEAMREIAKIALDDFMTLPEVQILEEASKEIIRRLFLRSIVLLQVAADCNAEKAVQLNDEAGEVLAPLLRRKPQLRIV